MRLDHVASGIIHANHDRMRTAVVQRVCDSIADRIRFGIPQPTERQHIADESDAGTILARADFGNMNERMQTQWWMRLTQGNRSSG